MGVNRPSPGPSPKLTVFRGAAWARLWDDFLVFQREAAAGHGRCWCTEALTQQLAAEVVAEHSSGSTSHLVPHTVLSAIYRSETTAERSTEGTRELEGVLQLQSRFLDSVGRIPGDLGGALQQVLLDSTALQLRAWPVCLRLAAVLHIRDRVRRGRDLPVTLCVLQDAAVAERLPRPEAVERLVDWILVADTPCGPKHQKKKKNHQKRGVGGWWPYVRRPLATSAVPWRPRTWPPSGRRWRDAWMPIWWRRPGTSPRGR